MAVVGGCRRWLVLAVAVAGSLGAGCGSDDGDVPEEGFDVGDCVTSGDQPEQVDCTSPDAAGEVIAEAGLLGDVEECPPETDFVVQIVSSTGAGQSGPDYCVQAIDG
jgi:hypothetical protein